MAVLYKGLGSVFVTKRLIHASGKCSSTHEREVKIRGYTVSNNISYSRVKTYLQSELKIHQGKAREKHCIKTIPAKRFERFANTSHFLLAPLKDKRKKTRGCGESGERSQLEGSV